MFKKKIDYKNKQKISSYDCFDLAELVVNEVIKNLGNDPLYIVLKDYYKNNYQIHKFFAKDMIIKNYNDYKNDFTFTIKGMYHDIEDDDIIYRNEHDAKKEALKRSMNIYKEDIDYAKKKLDDYNPVTIIESLEKEKEILINKYKKAKYFYDYYNLMLKINTCKCIVKNKIIKIKKCKKQKKIKIKLNKKRLLTIDYKGDKIMVYKKEIENAIKNNDSIWWVNKYWKNIPIIIEITKLNKPKINYDNVHLNINYNKMMYDIAFEHLYKTQLEAQHYLKHANITRIEKLPFVTWKDVKKNNPYAILEFDDYRLLVCLDDNWIGIINIYDNCEIKHYDEANEENFYKAYDECVKLFKGVRE